jgi:hypothetical protein
VLASGPQRSGSTSDAWGRGSIGSGNQANARVSAPVSVCGNAAAVLGDSAAGCEGTASVQPALVPEAGQAIPATPLAADSASGLTNSSFYSLAIGALVAGAVALKMAGRRSRDRYYPRGCRV